MFRDFCLGRIKLSRITEFLFSIFLFTTENIKHSRKGNSLYYCDNATCPVSDGHGNLLKGRADRIYQFDRFMRKPLKVKIFIGIVERS